ncbi:MAG: WbqC family protein [Deltaproteobacteria bacterium]|nr:WbqC family protein [Deltaproteobacteria bacterium]
MNKSDIFVFFDDVQFARGKTYTSRTKILIQGKEAWLTVPVEHKSGKYLIKDIRVGDKLSWMKKHIKTLEVNYKKAHFFEDVFSIIRYVYDNFNSEYLIDLNIELLREFRDYLELKTMFVLSSDICGKSDSDPQTRIINMIKVLKGTKYISGTGAGSKKYLNEETFKKEEIELDWFTYSPKDYIQMNNMHFTPYLSMTDLLFNMGRESVNYL